MALDDVSSCVKPYWKKRDSVVGAFWDADFLLFDLILRAQAEAGSRGNLLEIGALFGKSAIVLGCHAGDDEVIICDVFDDGEGDADNSAENVHSYTGLTRGKFESNYRRWVRRPPTVIAELSEGITERVEPQSLRFAHIDGGHLHNVVRQDISNIRGLMNDHGVLVMDDVRALHTPGVAAAVWEAVAHSGLIPVAISEQKFYGTWNPSVANTTFTHLRNWCAGQGDRVNYGVQAVADAQLLIIENPTFTTWRTRVEQWVPPVLQRIGAGRAARPYLGHR